MTTICIAKQEVTRQNSPAVLGGRGRRLHLLCLSGVCAEWKQGSLFQKASFSQFHRSLCSQKNSFSDTFQMQSGYTEEGPVTRKRTVLSTVKKKKKKRLVWPFHSHQFRNMSSPPLSEMERHPDPSPLLQSPLGHALPPSLALISPFPLAQASIMF